QSTCGIPGAVTCCRTDATGNTTCSIKRSAGACKPPSGGTAFVGSAPSCCDACGAPASSTTTTVRTVTSTTATIGPTTTTAPGATTTTAPGATTTTAPGAPTTTSPTPPTTTPTAAPARHGADGQGQQFFCRGARAAAEPTLRPRRHARAVHHALAPFGACRSGLRRPTVDRQHFRVRRAMAVDQLGGRWPADQVAREQPRLRLERGRLVGVVRHARKKAYP